MPDERTNAEKILWRIIGEPLYYCEECLKYVTVTTTDGDVQIKRHCNHTEARVIAPRKSILSGTGYAGLSLPNKIKSNFQQIAAKITGRNV